MLPDPVKCFLKMSVPLLVFTSSSSQDAIIAFLNSLVLFPPDDTASNLNPGDPAAENFPQNGHGNIKLPVLFNDPTNAE